MAARVFLYISEKQTPEQALTLGVWLWPLSKGEEHENALLNPAQLVVGYYWLKQLRDGGRCCIEVDLGVGSDRRSRGCGICHSGVCLGYRYTHGECFWEGTLSGAAKNKSSARQQFYPTNTTTRYP
jgi:hypothetical protein